MKRIITCSDGTWNKPNSSENGKHTRTNVQKLFDYVLHESNGVTQIKYYDEGIGASGSKLARIFNGATGKGIDDNIQDAYKFICWNYQPGDEIYLFGFSRGAYTARSLGGLIRKCGIIKKNDLNLIAEAYKMYRDQNVAPDDATAMAFKTAYSYLPMPNIKFIGVWDTVGALGIPLSWFQWYNKKKYQFHDTTLSSSVEYAYHALAIDEKRTNFIPTLWQQSVKAKSTNQVLEQRWFAGVHSNVGGGYPDEGLADISLQWMIDKAIAAGLSFDMECVKENVKPNVHGVFYESRSGFYKITKPFIRKVIADTFIDSSVNERMKLLADYKPTNIEVSNLT